MLLAFAPFLAFALLSRALGSHAALWVATLLCAALIIRERCLRHRSLKCLELGSLLLFGGLALMSRYPHFSFPVLQVRLIVDLGLLAIVLASIVVGRPFVLQYAVEHVSPQVAATARFKRVAFQLSLAWALAFVVIVAADLAMLYRPAFTPMAGAVVIFAALAGTAWFSGWWPGRKAGDHS